MVLTMDLCGSPNALDLKIGQLLWLGNWLLEQAITFDVRVLTGNGIESCCIRDEWSFNSCIQRLLCAPCVREGSIRDHAIVCSWQHHIGGEQVET